MVMMAGHAQEEQVPYLISNGGDVQTDGNTTIHIAIGEPVVTFNDGAEYVGVGFLQALSNSEPCPPDDMDCLCERSPNDPLCVEFELDNFNFLLDRDNDIIPPPTLQIEGTFHLTVFNRWGKQEFSTLETEEITSWEGTDDTGLLLDNGVYYYVLEHTGCKDGRCKGSVTILR
jgi:hypothetical protein